MTQKGKLVKDKSNETSGGKKNVAGKTNNAPKGKFPSKGEKNTITDPIVHFGSNILLNFGESAQCSVNEDGGRNVSDSESEKSEETSRFATAAKKWDRQHGHEVRNLYREGRSGEIEGHGHLNDSSDNVEVGDSEDNRDISGNGEDGDISGNGGEVSGKSGNDGESEENGGEIGIERGRVDSVNSGNEVGNENNGNSFDTGSVREDSGNTGLREDDGGNLNENAVDRCMERGNSGNERADSGENGNALSAQNNGNVVDILGQDSMERGGRTSDEEGEHSGRNVDTSATDKGQYLCTFCTATFFFYPAYIMHVENAHRDSLETIEEEFRNNQSIDYQVQMIVETESDSTVAVLDDNDEDERTLVE